MDCSSLGRDELVHTRGRIDFVLVYIVDGEDQLDIGVRRCGPSPLTRSAKRKCADGRDHVVEVLGAVYTLLAVPRQSGLGKRD